MKFTQGKWIVVHEKDGCWDVEYRDESGGGMIAQCGSDFESEANARLIAASKKLYESCQQALIYVENDEHTHGRKFAECHRLR